MMKRTVVFLFISFHNLQLNLKSICSQKKSRYEPDENEHPEIPDFDHNEYVPNQVASLIMNQLLLLQKERKISTEQLLF